MPDKYDPDTFFAAFMDDYYAESEEHLAILRRGLVQLEAEMGQPEVESAALIDELFRSFHTLKGLSSMVSVREAEELAHFMEGYLRLLRERRASLSEDGLDALMDGVGLLEQVIAAYRAGATAPAVPAMLERLAALADTPRPADKPEPVAANAPDTQTALQAETQRKLAAAQEQEVPLWHFIFTPAPELASRGINVNVARARLEAAGDLLHAAPIIGAGGSIAFEFVVASHKDEATFRRWQEEGITYTVYEPLTARAAPPTGATPLSLQAVAPSTIVRVDLARLDELMRLLGDLVISRARIAEHLARVEDKIPPGEWQTLQGVVQTMERQLRDLREGVMNVRMVPIGEIFARMQFVIRDLVRETDKEIQLETVGGNTEVDKFVVERMMDPLLHLVRNAVSHGFETAAERLAQGKAGKGTLSLTATTDGDVLRLDVADDGRGIDTAVVSERARELGLLANGEPLDPVRLVDILTAPGFSTRVEADRASGRGVGMAVVKDAVQELGGSLEVTTRVGQGTRFSIRLPLTLAIADALIISVGNQIFAVPQAAVSEIVTAPDSAVTHLENNELILYRGQALPLIRLSRFFHLPHDGDQYALVLGRGAGAVGLTAAKVLGRREIVVRPFVDPLIHVAGVAGATELGDGRPILILDTAALTVAARRLPPVAAVSPAAMT